ncbi:hypothetical protein NDI52_07245 [Leptolyngbya sp. PL-A3]|uniref:hypothetical protein n=1 Tax=Leptolyngbya sp. PL-A3 TaxID=2933911 RepID=UPI00329968B0
MKDQLRLNIATPAGVYEGTFDKTVKVQEVISTVVQQQGLSSGDSFELVYDGKVLAPVERPLVSFGLSDRAELDLVATGSGV